MTKAIPLTSVFCMLLTLTALGFSQAVSQMSGTTRDESGAVVPGVEVTATQTDTGIKRSILTNPVGEFVLANLQTGPYRLEASKAGFSTYVQTGLTLQVDSSPIVPITLTIGSVTQAVQVEANASAVETRQLGIGTVVESQRILELPLNGRTPTDLIVLTGAAVQTGSSPTFSMDTGVRISVAGGVDFGVYYGLDGAPHINLYDSTNMPLPFPDALQEFKVETSTQGAQTGTKSGAQVNSVTKSGTNAFHGDLFEFFRNGALNARNFFSTIPDNLKRNQFGGTLGGPVLKNKMFFFAGYQGTSTRQTPAPTTVFVPTPAMLGGDFSTFASAACQGRDTVLRAPFATVSGRPNQLPQSAISPVAVKLTSYLPKPENGCGLYRSYSPISQRYWQVPIRIDFQATSNHSIFFRYLGTKQNQVIPHELAPDNIINVGNNGVQDLATSATAGHTWLINSSTVNSLRLSLNRVALNHDQSRYFGPSELGINAFTYVPKAISFVVTGGPTIGSGTGLAKNAFYTYIGGNNDVSLIRGSHQLSFGVSLMHGLVASKANAFSAGQYTFNGQSTGLGLADLFAGRLSQIRQTLPNTLFLSQWFFGTYAQDTWKVSRRLTLNFGVRWEPFLPMQVKDSAIYNFSIDRFRAGARSRVWTNAPAGFSYPGDDGFPGKSGINASYKNFQPRFGFAFDPTGDGKTSIRAGAGLSYDFMVESSYQNLVTGAPFGGATVLTGPLPLADPWSTTAGGNPFPSISAPPLGKYPTGGSYLPVPQNFKTPRVYNWNLSVQHQFSSRLFISASYLGNRGLHLPTAFEVNPGVVLNVPSVGSNDARCAATTLAVNCTTNLNTRRALNLINPAAALGNVTSYDDGAATSYHGMLTTLAWRFASTWSVNLNHTWSHCIGNSTNGNNVLNPGGNYYHQENRALERANCDQDRRHALNLTVVARTPQFASVRLRRVASDWSLSAIHRLQSGSSLRILSGLDQALNGFNNTSRPDQVLAETRAVNQGGPCATTAPCVSWLNPSAFAQSALGTLGNIGAYNVAGPKFFQFDLSMVREFRMAERRNLQVRGEAFNVFNNVRFNVPAITLNNSALFGNITAAQDPRILQLALKLNF